MVARIGARLASNRYSVANKLHRHQPNILLIGSLELIPEWRAAIVYGAIEMRYYDKATCKIVVAS